MSEISKLEQVELLRKIKGKIDSGKKLTKKDMEFLYDNATKSIGMISFRGFVTGAAPKASKGGYYEIKFDTNINGDLAKAMTEIFKCAVDVNIDVTDGQGKLVDEDGIPLEDQERPLFSDDEVEESE